MVEVLAKIRTWGRSLGVVIPKEKAEEAKLKSGDEVRLLILDKKNPIRETFGIAKFSRPTQEILDEVDREGWDD